MTATAHALIGGAIASTVSDPTLGVTFAFISHPLVDLIPHWDFGLHWREKTRLKLFLEAAGDCLLGFILAYLIFGRNVDFWYFFACIVASEIWDVLEAPYWILGWKIPPFTWIYKVQSKMQGQAKLPWGIITQVITVVVITIVLQGRY